MIEINDIILTCDFELNLHLIFISLSATVEHTLNNKAYKSILYVNNFTNIIFDIL